MFTGTEEQRAALIQVAIARLELAAEVIGAQPDYGLAHLNLAIEELKGLTS